MAIKATPTNEHGVVTPPEYDNCVGERCAFREGYETCNLNRHHLHSTEDFYVKAGELATAFRGLRALTVWLPKCQHKDHHDNYDTFVPIPNTDVMEQAVKEGNLIHDLSVCRREISAVEHLMYVDYPKNIENKNLLKWRKRLVGAQTELLDKVHNIEVLPEELVTGALLFAAPNVAHERVLNGSDLVLTGTMKKDEIDYALDLLQAAVLEPSYSLQTGVNEVELAA